MRYGPHHAVVPLLVFLLVLGYTGIVQSEKSIVGKTDFSTGKTLSLPPSDILRNAPASRNHLSKALDIPAVPHTSSNILWQSCPDHTAHLRELSHR